MPRLDTSRFGHDDRALDDVPQLTHVAGIGVAQEGLADLARQGPGGLVQALARQDPEVLGQEQNVIASLAQRGNVNGEHAEPLK